MQTVNCELSTLIFPFPFSRLRLRTFIYSSRNPRRKICPLPGWENRDGKNQDGKTGTGKPRTLLLFYKVNLREVRLRYVRLGSIRFGYVLSSKLSKTQVVIFSFLPVAPKRRRTGWGNCAKSEQTQKRDWNFTSSGFCGRDLVRFVLSDILSLKK